MKYNIIYNKSCERMEEVDDNSIGLIVTSPVYNVGINYSGNKKDDKKPLQDYLKFIEIVMRECYRVLIAGCRLVINIADTGKTPYIPLQVYYTNILENIGFFNRGTIIWDKGVSARKKTSWGSYCSSSNPVIRDVHEFILVFSKGHLRKDKGESTITKEEFLLYTESIWRFNAQNRKSKEIGGHPAPFPVYFPEACSKLFSYKNDIVLDPFMGSGSTAEAAFKTGRRYIGYELEEKWCKVVEERIKKLNT